MLEKKKENRYQSIDELSAELQELIRNINAKRQVSERNRHTENSIQQKTDSRLDPEEFPQNQTGRVNRINWKRSYIYITLVTLLSIVVWAGLQFVSGKAKSIESIAVLPLENLSGNPEQEYFVSGMTDALITNLARISALKVISKTSVMHFKDADKPLPEIAQELKVDAIIEGSVMRAGDEIRITVQLIEAATDNHLWAESYDRNLRDVLKLQNDLAQVIVQQIKLKLTPQEQARLTSSTAVNLKAYQDYLKGNYFFDKHSEAGFHKSIKYFKAAIEKDSTYAEAYAGLAMSYIGLGSPGIEALHPAELMLKAKVAATKALELDGTSAEAHTIIGFVKLSYEWDWAGAEKELQRGVELNPNYALGHMFYSLYQTIIGDHKEAIASNKRALELDPLSVGMNVTLGNQFFEARQFDKAIKQHLNALEMNPANWHAHWGLGLAYTQKKMFDEAITEYEKALSLSIRNPFVLSSLGHVYAVSGRHDKAVKMCNELILLSEQRYIAPFALAQIYTGLNNTDKAIEWLEKGIEERSASMIWIGQNPILDSLRSDWRFIDLLEKMGLDKYNIDVEIIE